MANAVVAVFDEYNEAQSTVNELLVSGFSKNQVRLSAEDEGVQNEQPQHRQREGGIKGFFKNLFGVEENDDTRVYDEAVRHGNYVVTALADDQAKSELASEVMSHHHPVDIDERSSEWFGNEAAPSQSVSIPVIEEDVKVGKREVQRGGVRIFQSVSEVPVEEDLTLREEHIVVERIPVDKPASAADLGTFTEGTTELRETAEEAVVSKSARVVEEVQVGKQVIERREKVRETAKRADVEVERTGDDQYRTHWQQNYGSQGGRYEDYAPGYEFGSASAQRYQGRSFDEVEPDLRTEWERRYPESGWERFKDSVRHAFGKK